jgi:3-oxoacyl-[acyl-carrier protein] reductase
MDRESELMHVFAQLDALWGGLDVLINNAGIGRFEPMQEVEQRHFDEVFPTNVYGPALAGREAVKRFLEQGYGHIINVASSAGVKGFKNGTVYAASKFALRGMTECWREELRPHNIRVMLINPSAVPTAFNVTDRSEKELRDKMLTPNEIAHAAVAVLELDDRGFIPELGVWATNPF